MRTGFGHTAPVLAAALLLAGCGGKPAAQAAPPPAPAIQADGFNPASFDLDRPCTLLTPTDAQRIEGQPFFRTIAADRVEDSAIRCAQAVGDGGLQALVEAQFVLPADGRAAELTYVAMCRTASTKPEAPPLPGVIAPPPVEPPGPEVSGRNCRLATGAYAILLADRVLVASVRGSDGAIAPADTRRLAALLARRVGIIG